MDSDRDNMHLANCVDEVLEQCDAGRSFSAAPHVPIAGTSTVPRFSERLQVDLLFSGDLLVLHAIDVFSEYSHLIPGRLGGPEAVRAAFSVAWVGVCGQPKCI